MAMTRRQRGDANTATIAEAAATLKTAAVTTSGVRKSADMDSSLRRSCRRLPFRGKAPNTSAPIDPNDDREILRTD